jgi:ATP-binding cassette, subfamily B, bacterial
LKVIPFHYVRRVLRFLIPYRRLAATSVVVTAFSSLAAVLTPWPLKIIVDNVLGKQPLPPALAWMAGRAADNQIELLLIVAAAGLLIVLMQNTLHVLGNYVNTKIEQYITLDFRSTLFLHIQRLSLAYHDQRRAGLLIYLINFQGDAPAGLLMTIPLLAESALTLMGMFWITFRIDWQLALLSLAVVPFLYYSVGYYSTRIQSRLLRVRELEGEALAVVHESISMMRVIAAFSREEHEHNRFRRQTVTAVGERVDVTVRQTVFSLAVNMITSVGSTFVLGLGGYHVIQGRLTVGTMLVLIAYIAAVYKPLETISYTIGALQDRFVNLQITFDVLDTEPDIKDSPHAVETKAVQGNVKFEDVDFSYSAGIPTLKAISFEARAGNVIGIVGPTGAGKSTLVSLLPRFYDINKGRILLDGVDIKDLTLKSLRKQISIVLQEPLLFSGTIADNIRYGRLDATHDEIVEAAKAANAHDFISRLPQGYDTVLGERGAHVSGGERQRISVARAFLKNAPILILDEPTSSVDSKTESVIIEALDRLMAGRTTFLIAHRLSTLRHADWILVLNEGQLVEQGTPEDLLRCNGLFRQLYNAQTEYAPRGASASRN